MYALVEETADGQRGSARPRTFGATGCSVHAMTLRGHACAVCALGGRRNREHVDRLVHGSAALGFLRLGLVGYDDDAVFRQPRDSLDGAVHALAILVPGKLVDAEVIGDAPFGLRQPADPQRRGVLRDDAEPITSVRQAAVVLERQRFRQADRVDVLPSFSTAGKHLNPSAARATAGGSCPAAVPFAQPEEVGLAPAVEARQALQALVQRWKREVEPRARDVSEAAVVLAHLRAETAAARNRLDENEEPP